MRFAKDIRLCVKQLPKTTSNIEDLKQLSRSSGSIAANYIEANESISKKDFIHRIKICRKESKETILWLKLVDVNNNLFLESKITELIREATELMKIFSSIMRKASPNN